MPRITIPLLVFLLLIISFSILTYFVAGNPTNTFDLKFSQPLTLLANPLLDRLMIGVSLFGEFIPAIVLILGLSFWLYFKFQQKGVLLIVLTFLFALTADIFKFLIARPRPELIFFQDYTRPFSYSFPSGHVTFYSFFFGFLLFLALTQKFVNKWERILFILISVPLILLVGVSRLYLGVHWPTDVIAGYILGFLLLEIFILIYLYLLKQSEKTKSSVKD